MIDREQVYQCLVVLVMFLCSLLGTYVIISFITLDWAITSWEEGERAFFIFLSLVITVFCRIVLID